jgi:hypothetical protein
MKKLKHEIILDTHLWRLISTWRRRRRRWWWRWRRME